MAKDRSVLRHRHTALPEQREFADAPGELDSTIRAERLAGGHRMDHAGPQDDDCAVVLSRPTARRNERARLCRRRSNRGGDSSPNAAVGVFAVLVLRSCDRVADCLLLADCNGEPSHPRAHDRGAGGRCPSGLRRQHADQLPADAPRGVSVVPARRRVAAGGASTGVRAAPRGQRSGSRALCRGVWSLPLLSYQQ